MSKKHTKKKKKTKTKNKNKNKSKSSHFSNNDLGILMSFKHEGEYLVYNWNNYYWLVPLKLDWISLLLIKDIGLFDQLANE